MKIIKKDKFSRTTGLVKRVRELGRGRLLLETAADVFGCQNLSTHLRRMGYRVSIRRRGDQLYAYINTTPPAVAAKESNPRLKRALSKLRKDSDCLALTTPKEMAQFFGLREWLARQQNMRFKLMRNCKDVWVWRL